MLEEYFSGFYKEKSELLEVTFWVLGLFRFNFSLIGFLGGPGLALWDLFGPDDLDSFVPHCH